MFKSTCSPRASLNRASLVFCHLPVPMEERVRTYPREIAFLFSCQTSIRPPPPNTSFLFEPSRDIWCRLFQKARRSIHEDMHCPVSDGRAKTHQNMAKCQLHSRPSANLIDMYSATCAPNARFASSFRRSIPMSNYRRSKQSMQVL